MSCLRVQPVVRLRMSYRTWELDQRRNPLFVSASIPGSLPSDPGEQLRKQVFHPLSVLDDAHIARRVRTEKRPDPCGSSGRAERENHLEAACQPQAEADCAAPLTPG